MSQHIQIRGITPRIQYIADGINKVFEFPFAIFNTSDIQVYINDNLQDSSLYTVNGIRDTNGGQVTFTTAPANKRIVTIIRNLSIERTSDFQEGGALRAKVLNDEFDYQTACLQQVADNLNRSMVLPPYAADTNVNLTLPLPQAGKAIVWNDTGTNLENSTVSVNALESTLNGYKTSAETAAATAVAKADIATTQAGIATQQATDASASAQQAQAAMATKAEKDLSNVAENDARALVGNRIWISDEYNLSASANVVISHNLGITDPTKAIAIPYFKFTEAVEGYSVGDIISNAVMMAIYYTPGGDMASADGYGSFLNIYENTVIIPKIRETTNSVLIYNKNTGARKMIPASKVKVLVKIIY